MNDESISFLPLPIGDHQNQYRVSYLRPNGEQRSVLIQCLGETVEALITSFIEQHEPKLPVNRIHAVDMSDHEIRNHYRPSDRLKRINEDQLTLIERPNKTVEQDHVELRFIDRKTRKPFRPPVFLIRPKYRCKYSDLIGQINQIRDHLFQKSNIPAAPNDRLSWNDDRATVRPLEREKDSNDSLLFMKGITIEIEHEWAEHYNTRCNIHQSNSGSSLNGLLEDLFREEPLIGDYHCSKCSGLRPAKQKTDLLLPIPPVVIIQLKRFNYDTNSDAKIDSYISFPLTDLDLGRYVYREDPTATPAPMLYNLVAVSNHTGSLVSGHYITYAKNDRNKRWYSFNDEKVREITDEKDIVTKNAYILVYVQQCSNKSES